MSSPSELPPPLADLHIAITLMLRVESSLSVLRATLRALAYRFQVILSAGFRHYFRSCQLK